VLGLLQDGGVAVLRRHGLGDVVDWQDAAHLFVLGLFVLF
jgi:hypothetical protein